VDIIAQYLMQGINFFLNNWIAAAVLGLVIIIAAIKKPKELFKVITLIGVIVALLYLLIFIEKSMFSGVSSKKEGIERVEQGY
jgi:hypothetical protein